MIAELRKLGNSTGITIPKQIYGLNLDYSRPKMPISFIIYLLVLNY